MYLLFVKEYALPIKLIINLSTGQLVINSVVSITSLFVQIVCFLRTYSTRGYNFSFRIILEQNEKRFDFFSDIYFV